MRLHHVGLSSEHNEYMAITNIAKKLVWLRQLLAELGLPILLPTPVYGDNIQANKLCMEHFISTGNQYILTQYHFNKEKVADGTMTIIWLQTVDMLAVSFLRLDDHKVKVKKQKSIMNATKWLTSIRELLISKGDFPPERLLKFRVSSTRARQWKSSVNEHSFTLLRATLILKVDWFSAIIVVGSSLEND